MKHNITIRDVARFAGVSHQTVSRVINNKGEISATTRQRVLDAMQELDYRPSRIAQSLTTRRTFTVGLLVPNIANPFFSEIVEGAQNLSENYGYNVFLCNTKWQPEKEERFLESLADHHVDGVIINSSRVDREVLLTFAKQNCPIVLGGRDLGGPGISHVGWDHAYGSQLVAGYLVKKGHRAIGVLSGPQTAPDMSNSLRLDALTNALESCGVVPRPEWIVHSILNAEGGHAAALKLLQEQPELTAIIAHNDLMAIGAIRACRELKLRVPEDCAVIGFNDIELASMVHPTLTTVRINRYRMGQEMMQRMLEMIEKPDGDYPAKLLTDGEIIQRESA
jgi:LacI family transcriptional regulator